MPNALPLAAHNCYSIDSQEPYKKIDQALALGFDNIEVDVGWDQAAGRLIVSHDSKPKPGLHYLSLEDYLNPRLIAHWNNPRPDNAPHILTLDFKTRSAAAVLAFQKFLASQPNWFSSAPKVNGSLITKRLLTVCMSGQRSATRLYDDLIPAGAEYFAFSDFDFGPTVYFHDPHQYANQLATPFHRFLSLYWGQVERGGPGYAANWTEAKAERLRVIIDSAHAADYRIRLYTLNANEGSILEKFPTPAAARARWISAARAGADWIATDDYQDIFDALSADAG